jgi:hypothetical protein
MLEPLFVSEIKEKILLYLFIQGESYPTEIARAFGFYVNAVQNQLQKLERGGVLFSRLKGNLRLFGFNPRYPFKKELETLLDKVFLFVPDKEKKEHYMPRLKPTGAGKKF